MPTAAIIGAGQRADEERHGMGPGRDASLHGVRRFTEDVDLLVTEDGLRRLREALVGRGYTEIPGNARDIRHVATGVRIEFRVAGQYPGDGREKPVAFPDPAGAGAPQGGAGVSAAVRFESRGNAVGGLRRQYADDAHGA